MLIFKLLWWPSWVCRMPQINSVRGLSGIKAISKCEANQISSFQDIAFTSNCGRTDGWTDRAIPFDGRLKINH